jgi:predicted nucleotidyltransferase component of viral defense system
MIVLTLPPEALLIEKVAAYASRRKIRDLYDIYFLLNKVEDKRKVAGILANLLDGYAKPVDEPQLRATVLTGAVPSADEMIEGIRRWARKST